MSKTSKILEKLEKSLDGLQKDMKKQILREQTRMKGDSYNKKIRDRASQIKAEANPPVEDLETKVRSRYKLDKADGEFNPRDMSGVHERKLNTVLTHLIEEKVRRRNIEPTGQPLAKSFEDLTKEDDVKDPNIKDPNIKDPNIKDPKPKSDPPPRYKILTAQSSNPKTAKGENLPYESALLHLAPHTLAGCGNVCPAATPGCASACLNTAGRGGMIKKDTGTNTVQQARIRRTKELHEQPDMFWKKISYDINALKNRANFNDKKSVVRMNGTSDLAWGDFRPPELQGKNIFEAHPDTQFYDYTKRPDVMMRDRPDNYHMTFSRSEANHHMAMRMLKKGHNVAVVFGGKELPAEYNGHKVISGDDHDFRFLDPKSEEGQGGYVIGLKAKGEAKKDTSGFVVWDHDGNVGDKAAVAKEGESGDKLQRIKDAQKKLGKSTMLFKAKKIDHSTLDDHEFDQESVDIMTNVMKNPTKMAPAKPQAPKKNEFPNLHADMKASVERQKTAQKPGTLDYSKMKSPDSGPKWKEKAAIAKFKKNKEAIANAGGEKKMGPREVANEALNNRREDMKAVAPKFAENSNATKNKKLGKSALLGILKKKSPYHKD